MQITAFETSEDHKGNVHYSSGHARDLICVHPRRKVLVLTRPLQYEKSTAARTRRCLAAESKNGMVHPEAGRSIVVQTAGRFLKEGAEFNEETWSTRGHFSGRFRAAAFSVLY